jgi:hypothetical protein
MAAEVEWFVGIDWASENHQVCLVDALGECVGEALRTAVRRLVSCATG